MAIMQVRYIPTQADLRAVTRLLTRGGYRVLITAPALALGALILFTVLKANQYSPRFGLEVLSGVYAYFLLVLGIRWFAARRYNVREPDSLDVETVAGIDADGLTIATPRKRLFYRWACFTKVEAAKGYALLFTSPIRAHYIPRRAFYDERELQEFVAQAEAYRREALASPGALGAGAQMLDRRADADADRGGASAGVEESVWPPRPRQ